MIRFAVGPRMFTVAWVATTLIFVSIGGAFSAIRLMANFHAVVEGEVYRSAQPTAAALHAYRAEYKIATVLNLRGANPGKAWYDAEVLAAKELGVDVVDFRMSASHELTPDKSLKLISIMKSAAKPLLIHCSGGADRTSLASALYLAGVEHASEEAAEDQISIRFGHFNLSFLSTYAVNRSFEDVEPELGFPDS